MKRPTLLGFSVVLWMAFGVMQPATAANAEVERQRIALERAAAETRFAEQKAACQNRFAVTDCVDAARRARREALAPLRRQEIALDDALRKARAEQRIDALRSRAHAAQQRERDLMNRESVAPPTAPKAQVSDPILPPEAAASAVKRDRQPDSNPRPALAPKPKRSPSVDDLRTQEAANRARAEARRKSAEAHKEAVERRNAEREASGKRVAPLPVPSGASAP